MIYCAPIKMMIFVTWDNWVNVENIVLSELRQTGKA